MGTSLNVGPLPVVVATTAEDLGVQLAEKIVADLRLAIEKGRRYILGCPGGRSLITTYRAMGKLISQEPFDLSNLIIAMMDDYLVTTDNSLTYCAADAHFSCRRFAQEEIVDVLNKAVAVPENRISPEHVWFPDPSQPAQYDKRLAEAGGIDLFLIAAGSSDGHVAFNPPGSELESHSRVIELPDSTRRDNMRTFPAFKSLDEVPTHGISVGLATISALSREVILVIHGAEKRFAVRQLGKYRDFAPEWPATIIFRCRQAKIYLDVSSASELFDK